MLHSFDSDSRQLLFAHYVALSVNAVAETYNRRPPGARPCRSSSCSRRYRHGGGGMDTVHRDLSRSRHQGPHHGSGAGGNGERVAEGIAHLRKGEMGEAAQALLAGSGWLPEPLRTPGRDRSVPDDAPPMETPEIVIDSDPEAPTADLEPSVELDCPLAHAIATE